MTKFFVIVLILLYSTSGLFLNVHAQLSTCDFLPCSDEQESDPNLGESLNSGLENTILTAIDLVFVGIIVYGIFLIIKSALKIIRSEANDEQLMSGYKGIKTVMIGIALIFVGIIGIVLITAIFGATEIFNQDPDSPLNTLPFAN